ncbi:MAG TPA: serine hydrolase domain-containing protein [Ktedonobacteraceae bacterium]|nr:serine hydrolase domain-containing protein [Ktedonobacteraceae bacterium]
MYTQQPLPDTQKQPVVPNRRGPRRSLLIIATILLTAGLISLVAFIILPWAFALQHIDRLQLVSQKTAQSQHPVVSQEHPHAQPTVVPTSTTQATQLASQIDSLLAGRVAQHTFSGSVLIARDGQVLLEKGYGMANWSNQLSNDVNTRFYLGSVTKEFTATALLILQQQGKLDVKKSICVYITPCPAPWQPVTLHEILTHTSGIPELDTSELSGASPAAWIASFDASPLYFTPGSQFSYCSVCYQILAYVVEVVSGQPYAQFLQQHIFDPLKMQTTGFDSASYYAQSDHANGYANWQVDAGQLGWAVSPDWTFLFGSGLLYTTVGDIYRWDQGLDAHTLLSKQTQDLAYVAYSPTSLFEGSGYGYGWFIAQSPVAGHRLIWHDGVIDGFRTYNGRYLDDNVTIIFLSNLATLDSLSLAHSLEQVIFSTH